MKRLKFILVAAIVSIVSQVANATVTITAPVKPEGIVSELTPGESYYLFNLGKGQFVNRNTNNDNYTGWSDTPYAFRLDESSDGYYALWQGSSYLGGYWEVGWGYTSDKANSYIRLDIQNNDDNSYKIREVGHNCLWGYYSNSSYSPYIYSNYTTSSTGSLVNWIFIKTNVDINIDDILRYYHTNRLYNAIVAADIQGSPILYYENIYNDGYIEEIKKATIELNAIDAYSTAAQCIVPDWNDYPIQLYSEDFVASNNIRRAVFAANTYGQTKSMSANVVITEPSTLVMNIHSDNEDHQRVLFPIDVYVDGTKKYSYTGDLYLQYWTQYRDNYYSYQPDYNKTSSSSGYRRIFTELTEVGEHRIDVVFTNNMNDNSSHAIAFNTFGIEKTPTITVNVAKEGQLGDEILRAMDNHPNISETNIRNVRKLVVSGKLNDADMELLKSMTSLYTLDISETNITSIKYNQFCRTDNPHLAFFHDIVLPKGLTRIEDRAFLHSYVENVDIPEGVEYIGYNAFADTYIHKAIMPNVTTIGEYAFFNCPHLKEVKTVKLENLGRKAFQYNTNLEKVELRGTYSTLPWAVFDSNTSLKDIVVEDSIVSIEKYAFYNCYNVPLFTLSQHLKTIGLQAFGHCNVSGELPNSITSIGDQVFIYSKIHSNDSILHLPANVTYGSEVFRYSNVKNVVVPDGYYSLTPSLMFANCDSLKSVKFLSPTKTTVAANFVEGLNKKDLKILVPQHLNYAYRLDNYWMDFNIVPFSTAELDSIVVRQDLALSQHDRFLGNPDLAIEKGIKFELEGSAGMDLKNATISSNLETNSYAQIVSATDQVVVNGLASERLYTKANKWYFMALPFDCNLSKTVNENGGRYAIRYYDGAGRAAEVYYTYPASAHNYANNLTKDSEGNLQTFSCSGAKTLRLVFNSNTKTYNASDVIHIMDAAGEDHTYSGSIGALDLTLEGDHFDIWITSNNSSVSWGYALDAIYADDVLLMTGNRNFNWKNYDCTKDVIPAGTGFIFMTSQDSWTRFYSADNGTKNRIFEDSENENNEFHYELQKHPSENAANRGWNLVGNPYPNYYNNHKISFAAPITLWDGTTYKAYSLRDDDIAIKPNQAVFVQCPEDVAEISWPAAGRQTTSVITDQANARPRTTADSRQIIDLALTNGTFTDDTRVVINPKASLNYEVGCDAGKFMSMDNAVQQLYTMDTNQNRYAINERPLAEGSVALGTYFPTEGTYTISLKRNQAQTVLLTDRETGFTHDLTADDYTFTAKAGTDNARFVITIASTETDGIENIENAKSAKDSYYNIAGQRISSANAKGITIVNGKKVAP